MTALFSVIFEMNRNTTNTPRVTPGPAQLKSSREPHVGK
jgi:hypothetical protein